MSDFCPVEKNTYAIFLLVEHVRAAANAAAEVFTLIVAIGTVVSSLAEQLMRVQVELRRETFLVSLQTQWWREELLSVLWLIDHVEVHDLRLRTLKRM